MLTYGCKSLSTTTKGSNVTVHITINDSLSSKLDILSPSDSKPRTKRTHRIRGTHFRGAQGDHARRDANVGIRNSLCREGDHRPVTPPSLSEWSGDTSFEEFEAGHNSQTCADGVNRWTFESAEYSTDRIAQLANQQRQSAMIDVDQDQPLYDECGRRIVYINDADAWSLRKR